MLDAAHERGTAAQQKAVGLIQKNYAKLAGQMRDLMLELRDLDQVVKEANKELERAADARRLKEPDDVARSQEGWPSRHLQKPIYQQIVLPSAKNPVELLYPATDVYGSALRSAA